MYRDGIDIDNEVKGEMFGEYVDEVLDQKFKIGQMMIDIEVFFQEIEERRRTREQKRYKKSLSVARSTKIPQSFFKYPIYRELKEIIVSLEPEVIVPRRWEELEIDFSNPYIRYCSLCDVHVYKVSNLFHYRKAKAQNMALAIPVNSPLVKRIEINHQSIIENYRFVQVSRRMMQESGYRGEEDFSSCEFNKILDEIRKYISCKGWIDLAQWEKKYWEYGIELEKFL